MADIFDTLEAPVAAGAGDIFDELTPGAVAVPKTLTARELRYQVLEQEKQKLRDKGEVGLLGGLAAYAGDTLDNFTGGLQRGYYSSESARGLQAGDLGMVAHNQQRMGQHPASEDLQRVGAASGVGESVRAFMRDPLGIGAEATAESLAALFPTLARVAPARVAVGAGLGAAAGAPAGGIGAAPGALLGAGAGLMEATGRASYDLEYAGKFLEVLQEAGYDPASKDSLAQAFEDKALVAKAHTLAHRKALVIGATDTASAMVGGRIITQPARGALNKVGQGLAETGVQGLMGGAGEAGGQSAAGEPFQPGPVLLETVVEPFGSAHEIALGALQSRIKAEDQFIRQAMAENPALAEALSRASAAPGEPAKAPTVPTPPAAEGRTATAPAAPGPTGPAAVFRNQAEPGAGAGNGVPHPARCGV